MYRESQRLLTTFTTVTNDRWQGSIAVTQDCVVPKVNGREIIAKLSPSVNQADIQYRITVITTTRRSTEGSEGQLVKRFSDTAAATQRKMPKYSRSQCTNTVKTRLDFHEFLLQDDRSDGLESERNADGGIRLDAAFHLRTRELFAQRFETHESPCHWQCGWILHRQRLSLPPTTQSYHYAHKCCLLGHCTVGTRRHWYSDYRHVWIGETKWSVPPGLWTGG